MKKAIVAVVLFVVATLSFGADNMPTSVDLPSQARASASLAVWSEKQKLRMGVNNPGYRMYAGKELCQTMRAVGLGCTYNDRVNLVEFLSAHGVDLFPCEGGTNPYTSDMCGSLRELGGTSGFFNYIGQPVQNAMLQKSILKNRALFKNGDLTATSAKAWRK